MFKIMKTCIVMIVLISFSSLVFAGDDVNTLDRLAEHIEKNGISDDSVVDQEDIDQAIPVEELDYSSPKESVLTKT